ncbi:MAG: hypothetical protein AB1540_13690, partial [Bdellovibrionota bacterium]
IRQHSIEMWDNQAWAAKHIRRHDVTTVEAWEVVFEDKSVVPPSALDQITWPPYRRWWTIGKTKQGRTLFVVWDQHRHLRNLITAFEPDAERTAIYERQKKLIKKNK